MADWVILGCGYTGTRLARQLLAEGHRVRVTGRRLARLAPLEALGAELHHLDASKLRAFGPALYGLHSPTVVYSIPPVLDMPAGEPLRRAADAAMATGAERFIYLSSTAVYGETESGVTVDEESPTATGDAEAMPRIIEEAAVESARLAGLRSVVLRLAAIYGPGRGVRERLLAGNYTMLDGGVHYYSRVHVDDLVGIIRAAAARAPLGALYCVADSRPSTQREYVEWLCGRLGLSLPASTPTVAAGQRRRAVRNRRVSSAKLVRELDYAFLYPSFAEGELAIEREAAGLAPETAERASAAAPEPGAPPASTMRSAAASPAAGASATGEGGSLDAPPSGSAVPGGESVATRASSTTPTGAPHTLGEPTGAPHTLGEPTGAPHTVGVPTGAPHTVGVPTGAPHTVGVPTGALPAQVASTASGAADETAESLVGEVRHAARQAAWPLWRALDSALTEAQAQSVRGNAAGALQALSLASRVADRLTSLLLLSDDGGALGQASRSSAAELEARVQRALGEGSTAGSSLVEGAWRELALALGRLAS